MVIMNETLVRWSLTFIKISDFECRWKEYPCFVQSVASHAHMDWYRCIGRCLVWRSGVVSVPFSGATQSRTLHRMSITWRNSASPGPHVAKGDGLGTAAGASRQLGHPVGEETPVGQTEDNGCNGNLHTDHDGCRFPGPPGLGWFFGDHKPTVLRAMMLQWFVFRLKQFWELCNKPAGWWPEGGLRVFGISFWTRSGVGQKRNPMHRSIRLRSSNALKKMRLKIVPSITDAGTDGVGVTGSCFSGAPVLVAQQGVSVSSAAT